MSKTSTPAQEPAVKSITTALPPTAHVAIEFPDEMAAQSFLQMCLDQRPSVRVTLIGPSVVSVARDQLSLLEPILEKHPPEKVTSVHPLSERSSQEAARIRGWQAVKDAHSRRAILDSYDAMLAKLKKLAHTNG